MGFLSALVIGGRTRQSIGLVGGLKQVGGQSEQGTMGGGPGYTVPSCCNAHSQPLEGDVTIAHW